MTRLPLFTALLAASAAAAQPLDAPPAIRDTPQVQIKGEPPAAELDAAELLPPKHEVHGETLIQQRRQGTRVREIIVTPAGQTYSYSIQNREGRLPLSTQDLSSGLSTPRFLKFEF